MTRYLSGLCVAGLGLCGGGWLIVAAVAFGGESAGLAGRVNLLTGAGLIAVCCLSLVCWSFAWRQRMCVDGVLADAVPGGLKARGAAEQAGAQPGRPARRQARGAVGARRQARRAAVRAGRRWLQRWRVSEGGVRSAGVGLASAPADEPRNVAVSYGASANSANGRQGVGEQVGGRRGVNGPRGPARRS